MYKRPMPPPVQVRPAVPEDAEALGRMGAALVRFHHAFDPQRFMLPGGDLEAGYAGYLTHEGGKQNAVVLVAHTEGGEVIGYAYGRLEGRDWSALREPCGVLDDLWVNEAHRGRGAARALCEAMKEHFAARGAPRVVLMTAVANARAQRLFERLGFRPTMVELTCELSTAARPSPR